MTEEFDEYKNEARDTFHALLEISNLLNTGLDAEALSYCIRLCESGVHPACLANVVKEVKREVELIKQEKVAFEKACQENE